MIERALAGEEGAAARRPRWTASMPRFIEHYAGAHCRRHSRPFPHHQVDARSPGPAAGYRLAVCTNKLEWLSKRLFDTLQLADRFAAICGQDTFAIQKPNPEMFRMTVRRAGGEPAHAIMVGNSKTDISTARAAGVPVIAVDFGYSDVPIATLQPDRIISSFTSLPAAIADLSVTRA